MKEAMWKADESGEFRFSDATDPNQLVLFEKAPNVPTLRSRIVTEFSGREATVANIEQFVLVETAFRESHYKAILKTLEKEGVVQVLSAPAGRRSGTFGNDFMLLKFA